MALPTTRSGNTAIGLLSGSGSVRTRGKAGASRRRFPRADLATAHRLRPGPAFRWHGPLAAALLGMVVAFPASSQRVQELDRIVAIVNDDVIMESELRARMDLIRSGLEEAGTPMPPADVLARQVLERLVLDSIQLQLAAEAGMRIEDEELNRTMDDLARRNNLSPSEFRQILERDGYDIEALREDIREELLVAQVQRRFVTNRVTVSQRDVDDFLATVEKQGGSKREYRLAHILISVPEGASPEDIDQSREEAQALVSELRAGGDFAEAAVARSDGRQALEGGDLGWRKANELPTLFAHVVPTLSIGEVSEPIRSPSGFHIVQVADSRRGETHVLTQTRARHILLEPNEVRSDADARAQLAQLRERIINGDDFALLARAHSDDPGNAAMGGDLGWLSPGGVLPALQEVIDTLEESELSAPVKTERGWHLVQVLERRAYDGTEEVRRAGAVSAIRNRKIEEELPTWIRRIREEAYVELRLDEE